MWLSWQAESTTFTVAGSQGNEGEEKVVIYSNADDEAVECMKAALDENGYKGQYILQTFGTSELGGKLLAEGEKYRSGSDYYEYFLCGQRTEGNKRCFWI